MTGMKEGAGEDPFADTSNSTDTKGPEETAEATEASDNQDSSDHTNQASSDRSDSQQLQIPYKYRRDGVQDGRDRVPLFLMEETKQSERDALREMEERFGDNVSLTDLREAVMKVGLAELDAVEDALEDWGYGMTFEE